MTKKELKELLDAEGFNPLVYDLEGGLPENKLVLSDEASKWCVYHSERGNRFDEKCFKLEADACSDILNRLRSLPEYQTKFK